MTDDEPPELGLRAQKHHTEAVFFARDPNGNRYRYVHLGNVERKRLAELIAGAATPKIDAAEADFWGAISDKLSTDLDDL